MFHITRDPSNGNYVVKQFIAGNPEPVLTDTFDSNYAWIHAFGRAAQIAILRAKPQDVITEDGRTFRVIVTEVLS